VARISTQTTDDELEQKGSFQCPTQKLGAYIAAGQRSYFLFLLTTLFALGEGIVVSTTEFKLDAAHALGSAGVLLFMAYCAWVAGASVDKRIARVAHAFWSKKRREEIRTTLFASSLVNGGRKSITQLSEVGRDGLASGQCSSRVEREASAE
jgi:hypothetical protein